MIHWTTILPLATNWSTISALATGVGTLVLAVATFASVRSSNRSARVAEQALQEQRRPVLAPSRFDDPVQKIMFIEGHWVRAEGARGVAEHVNGNVYLAMSLRNVGAGIGVCQAWAVTPGLQPPGRAPTHLPESEFRTQTRDLYIPAGDIGMWQGAIRDRDDPVHAGLVAAIDARQPISLELLYSDQVGDQRTITRFGLIPIGDDAWLATVNRHWFLDRPGPRSERDTQAAAEAIMRRVEAASREQDAATEEAEAAGADLAIPEPNGAEPSEREQARDYSSSGSSPSSGV
jgi:hypothetical protein